MRKWMRAFMLAALLACVPVKGLAQEISITQEVGNFTPGSYTAMVTAGTVGVAASAGLLLLINRRNP